MVSVCKYNYARMYAGNEVCKLFEKKGMKVTKSLSSIIDGLLNEYGDVGYIRSIQKIFSRAKKLYNTKSKPQT